MQYTSLFPWFGNKEKIASHVWRRFGDVDNYIEPFFGSGAVYFLRPTAHRVATINDKYGMIVNFFRSLKHSPLKTAIYAAWPTSEIDLVARHIYIVERNDILVRKLQGDPEYHDPKLAGWWVWGQSNWIAAHWCEDAGYWGQSNGFLVKDEEGILSHHVYKQRPQITTKNGIARFFRFEKDINQTILEIYKVMQWFSKRLTPARILCTDWRNLILNKNYIFSCASSDVAFFIDPPYSLNAKRDNDIYTVDDTDVAIDVRNWAIENGNRYKIAFCGYYGEHFFPDDWEVLRWTASVGYSSLRKDGINTNRYKECIWFSPSCIKYQEVIL